MSSRSPSYKSGGAPHLSKVNIVLLGSTKAGKSSAGNTILGKAEFSVEGSAQCETKRGEVSARTITVVEAPGWQRNRVVRNAGDLLKKEIVRSVSVCVSHSPRAVLLVLRLDAKSWWCERTVLRGYLKLLPERMWSVFMVLFTVRDALHDSTVKRHVARVEQDLRWLFEKCGNRYHVFNRSSKREVAVLLEKIEKMLAGDASERRLDMVQTKEEIIEQSPDGIFPVRRPARIVSPIHTRIPNHPGLYAKEHSLRKTPLKQESGIKSAPKTSKTHNPIELHLFTPELFKTWPEDKNSEEYGFLCPHAGQFKCKLTDLVFGMESGSLVKYRIVSWDQNVSDGVNPMEPAGPLYDIHCLQGVIRHLGLPHCESHKELAVAHVSDGNVEIIRPLDVTNTHAVINIGGFSLFGLVTSLLFQTKPISAQVLLFHDTSMNKLHVHLTPENVPVEEVRKRHENVTYITTTSKCQLTPGQTYRPCCKTTDNNDIQHQPEKETFERDYGPNFHPTFEVLFETEVNEVTLGLLDVTETEVWKPRTVKLTSTEKASSRTDTTDAVNFVDKHRLQLVQRISSIMEIADCLKSRNMISGEMYSSIQAAATPQNQMRELYKHLDSGGRKVKAAFYQILKRTQPYLVLDLEPGSI